MINYFKITNLKMNPENNLELFKIKYYRNPENFNLIDYVQKENSLIFEFLHKQLEDKLKYPENFIVFSKIIDCGNLYLVKYLFEEVIDKNCQYNFLVKSLDKEQIEIFKFIYSKSKLQKGDNCKLIETVIKNISCSNIDLKTDILTLIISNCEDLDSCIEYIIDYFKYDYYGIDNRFFEKDLKLFFKILNPNEDMVKKIFHLCSRGKLQVLEILMDMYSHFLDDTFIKEYIRNYISSEEKYLCEHFISYPIKFMYKRSGDFSNIIKFYQEVTTSLISELNLNLIS